MVQRGASTSGRCSVLVNNSVLPGGGGPALPGGKPMPPRILKLLLPLAAAGSLSACTGFYDDYGYGYGGVSVGYSTGYSSGYGRGYYDDDYYGYYASRPYWGWYN